MTLEPYRKSNPAALRPTLWRGLTLQLFVLIVLPLTALMVAVTVGSQELHNQAMRELVGERDMLSVHTAAAALTEQVQQRANTVRLLSIQTAHTSRGELPAVLDAATFLAQDFDQGFAFYTLDGSLEASSSNAGSSPALWKALGTRLGEYRSQLQQRSPETLLIPNDFTDAETGGQVFVILAADPSGARLTAGAFTSATLAERVLSVVSTEGHHTGFILVDPAGKPIYQSGQTFTEGDLSHHAGVREALDGKSGATYQPAGDSEHVVAYSPVVPLGWGLVSEEPWEMLDTPLLRTTQAAPLVLIPVLLLTLVALWFTVSQIVRPLQNLGTKSAQLAEGNFQAIEEPVGGIAEIQQLQTGLIDMAQAVRRAQQSLHHYIGAITSAQEEERRRLARDLHDDTIQDLIALKQRVYLTRMKYAEAFGDAVQPGAANGSLDEIAGLTEQTIENLRRVTRALRPIYLEDLGLATALEMLARETGQASELMVTFQREGDERRLPPETELALYRMAQEALNNAARHSQAAHAGVTIAFSSQAVTLEVVDDGTGFRVPATPAEFAPSGHYGLLGLHERAELIGARLEIQSKPGHGTRVKVTVL